MFGWTIPLLTSVCRVNLEIYAPLGCSHWPRFHPRSIFPSQVNKSPNWLEQKSIKSAYSDIIWRLGMHNFVSKRWGSTRDTQNYLMRNENGILAQYFSFHPSPESELPAEEKIIGGVIYLDLNMGIFQHGETLGAKRKWGIVGSGPKKFLGGKGQSNGINVWSVKTTNNQGSLKISHQRKNWCWDEKKTERPLWRSSWEV